MPRVVSLLPSATEIVSALGGRNFLVGRSEECDYPPSVRSLPVVMKARTLDGERSSGEIDSRVQSTRANGEALYEIDRERLGSLAPDVILTQDLCGVCSVGSEEVNAACRGAGIDPRVVTLAPRRLDDVWDSIETVGEAIGLGSEGAELAERLRSRGHRSRRDADSGARVAVVEWLEPPILAGLWTPDIVRAAGGVSVGPTPGGVGARTRWEEISEAQPDLVVLGPCSFPVPRTSQEVDRLGLRPFLKRMAPSRGVWLADEAYFSRPGPRLADGVQLVRDLLDGRPPSGPMPTEDLLAAPVVAS